jgi:hypothetical protein
VAAFAHLAAHRHLLLTANLTELRLWQKSSTHLRRYLQDLNALTYLFALQFAPRNVTIQAFINKAPNSVAVTQPRSINELDFSKGGLPLYLWVPRGDLNTRPAEIARERNVNGAAMSSRAQYPSFSQNRDLPPQLIFQVCFARQNYTASENLTLMLTVT